MAITAQHCGIHADHRGERFKRNAQARSQPCRIDPRFARSLVRRSGTLRHNTIKGYTVLEGTSPRGASSFILDILTRLYLDAMLNPRKLQSFTEWSTISERRELPLPTPQPLLLAVHKILRQIPKRSEFAGSLKEWQMSSKEYQKLSSFCELFHERFGPVFADEDDGAQHQAS